VCTAIRDLGAFQPFSLFETTNIPRGSIGEVWRTETERIKEMVLEQRVSQRMESQNNYRRRSECLVGMDSVVAVIGIFLFILGF
jgi:hypothetical protein